MNTVQDCRKLPSTPFDPMWCACSICGTRAACGAMIRTCAGDCELLNLDNDINYNVSVIIVLLRSLGGVDVGMRLKMRLTCVTINRHGWSRGILNSVLPKEIRWPTDDDKSFTHLFMRELNFMMDHWSTNCPTDIRLFEDLSVDKLPAPVAHTNPGGSSTSQA